MPHDSSDDEQVNQNRLTASLKYFTSLEENVSNSSNEQEQAKLVKNMIRLALFTEESRREMSREEIGKLVLKDNAKAFLAVFVAAQKQLKDTFGVEMVQVTTRDRKKTGGKLKNSYILR
jgi:MAGE family